MLREMGCSVLSLNAQPDGYFPGRMPEPTEDQLTDLMRNVVGREANLGIAHDGDGDRMVAVDENGHFVDGDKLLALFASVLGATGLVAPIDASMVLDDMVKGNVVRTKVGDVYVAEALKTDRPALRRRAFRNVHLPQGDLLPRWGICGRPARQVHQGTASVGDDRLAALVPEGQGIVRIPGGQPRDHQ